MKCLKQFLAPGDFFTAKYFFLRALVLCGLFAIAHFSGLREHTTFLSGTAAGADFGHSAILGIIYLLLYFGCVVFAPILFLASGILWVARRVVKPEFRS